MLTHEVRVLAQRTSSRQVLRTSVEILPPLPPSLEQLMRARNLLSLSLALLPLSLSLSHAPPLALSLSPPTHLPDAGGDGGGRALGGGSHTQERELCIDNLLVRIHLIIEMVLVDRLCFMGVCIPIFQIA